jgi:hypothetical protein
MGAMFHPNVVPIGSTLAAQTKEAEMQRSLLLAVLLLAAGAAAMPAQQIAHSANLLDRPTSMTVQTIMVPPRAGAPFSATVTFENQKLMPDGSIVSSRNVNLIGRDSRGRTHGETRMSVPEDTHGDPPLIEVHIYDPQTRIQTVYEPASHIASRQLLPEPQKVPIPSRPRVTEEELYTTNMAGNRRDEIIGFDGISFPEEQALSHGYHSPKTPATHTVKIKKLGTKTLDNIKVKGTRRTLTIPAQATTIGTPITVVDECWYSKDLDMNVEFRHSDPRTGSRSITLTGFKREEPNPAFFEIPAGYKVVDMTPPPGAPVNDIRTAPGSPAQ